MKTIYIYLVSLILLGTACNKFDDINTNPNVASNVVPSLLATPLLLDLTATGGTASGFIEDNCLAKQMIWFEFLHNYNYNNIGRASLGGYKKLLNGVKMVEAANAEMKNSYQALFLFLKAYKCFYYSMQVGDIPYSEALLGEEGVLKPKYDSQKEVMLQILADLENASKLFASAKNFDGDPLYGGNTKSWQKATDAFRLKVLMYLSKKENEADLKIKEHFSSIVQNGLLFETNEDNLQLTFTDKAGQIYPYNRSVSNHYYWCTISTVIIDTLKAYNDYRLFYFAQPAKTQLEKGIAPDSPDAYVGLDPSADYYKIQKQYSSGNYSAMNLRYTDLPSGEPYTRLGYAEQNFILAEAVLRGWISGDPTEYYNKGIEASMQFIVDNTPDDPQFHQGKSLTKSYIQTYLNSDAVKLRGSFDHKLNQIITQKYITYYMQYPYDAYYEYRRTGYPELPINPETNLNPEKDKIPVRWMYPTGEFDYNKENLESSVEQQYGGVDDINKRMWIVQ